MTAVSDLLSNATPGGHIRPFDPRRDLNRVADLVELCFADTLDEEGRTYLRHMRSAARNPGYLPWSGMISLRARLPLSGYVWEEDNRVVGNLTLIPYVSLQRNYYLFANVAVHPDYRRRGIARGLTHSAIEHVRRRGARSAWLHVRAENDVATNLYRSMGFVKRASRTSWHSGPGTAASAEVNPEGDNAMAVKVVPRRGREWPAQRIWLKKLYPPNVTWHLPLRMQAARPGLWGFLYRTFNDIHMRQWSAWRDGSLTGVVAWQSSLSYTDHLWLAVNPDGDGTAVAPLLEFARRHSSPRRKLALDFPSGLAAGEIESAGFREHQTLVWMELGLTSSA